MTTQNTPGPWIAEAQDKCSGISKRFDIYPPQDMPIGSRIPVAKFVSAKDVNLIVAAPEMLTALMGFQAAWDENRLITSDEAAAIRAAIAKATGGAA